jgi:DNA (cytosine-5)-methyltransferase 1
VNVGSLFSGIGGLDLGLERAGMNVVWQSEIDPYACRVLAKHWPHVPNLGDVTTIDWSTVERPDLICGGYPCQPFSLAGVRRGEDDPRHLWPHFRDAIRHLRPRFALLENVPGHLSLGFGRVLGDLAELGYDCEWDCIPAAAVGAPHLRYRVFVVAYADSASEPGITVDAVTRPGVMVSDADGAGLGE